MTYHLQHIRWLRDNRSLADAHQHACERIVQTETQLDAAFRSQFLERTSREDGSKFYRQVTEQYVSNSFDMADCDDNGEFFWCDPKTGDLHPVTTGRMERHAADEDGEMPLLYASSALIANGQAVGYVQHTDH